MSKTADVIVVGAGIAGASAAFELSGLCRVVVLEREDQPGYHATGRSAALFSETYGPAEIKALSRASRAFYTAPPDGFGDGSLLTARGSLMVAREDQAAALQRGYAAGAPFVEMLDARQALEMVPVIRSETLHSAMLEPGSMDIDVHGLHSGYLRGLGRKGGTLSVASEAVEFNQIAGGWRVTTREQSWEAPVLVNAAGAWGDVVAARAGVGPLGLVPKRRSAFVFDGPAAIPTHAWPMVIDADEEFYFKPDAGRLIGSPADATPVEPQDVQPEDIDIATAAWRIEQATTLEIKSIGRRWAGLRSFVADGVPAIGFDAEAEGFFWLVGQGGYGIQSAPAAGKLAAAIIFGDALPADLSRHGVDPAQLSPARLSRRL